MLHLSVVRLRNQSALQTVQKKSAWPLTLLYRDSAAAAVQPLTLLLRLRCLEHELVEHCYLFAPAKAHTKPLVQVIYHYI
eukprot:5725-Heterococcus_DN1.PRE.5